MKIRQKTGIMEMNQQPFENQNQTEEIAEVFGPPVPPARIVPAGRAANIPEEQMPPENQTPEEQNTGPEITISTPADEQPEECGLFLAALIPCLVLVVLGLILLGMHFATGQSDTVFSLAAIRGTAGQPMAAVNPDSEVRGVYVATVYNINYPSAKSLSRARLREELDAILDSCEQNGLNAVYFQVSPYSDALYHSQILPTSSVVTGREGQRFPGDFDPLDYLCEHAHARGIAVHAWVNPMRVTTPEMSYDTLARDNPAKVHPEWTVEYGGAYYYDLGIPEVRQLQADVCAELAANYPIDGILFDDYFYPYPVDGKTFDDAQTYADYGADAADLADFRRQSTTALVRACYTSIKETREDCAFGIAPFGIWRNDDGRNGGSPTRGFESYESLYCDSLAFIRGGWVDYVAPQIYWQFSSQAAPYGALCEWWNAAVADTDVKLLISHAAYQAEAWGSPSEFTEQIEYARALRSYGGSLFYGLAAIQADDGSIRAQLASAYATEYVYLDFTSTGDGVTAILRDEGDTLTVKGISDVAYPLYYNGSAISQHKDGSFAFSCPMPADRQITLTQNKTDYIFSLEGE